MWTFFAEGLLNPFSSRTQLGHWHFMHFRALLDVYPEYSLIDTSGFIIFIDGKLGM
jgi:hypothetical protein